MNLKYDVDQYGFVPWPPVVSAVVAQPVRETSDVSVESSILSEADAIAGQSRSRDYGHPYDNHERIAAIWNVQLGGKLTKPIEPREVALMMIGLKLAREVNSPKRDNLVDAAGYLKCIEMIDQETERRATSQ